MELTGGCLCGAVRYKAGGTPIRRFLCHCRDCQKATGSAFQAAVTMPRAEFTWLKGAPAAYTSTADSGRSITRLFCPLCGSGLANRIQLRPDVIVLRAGSLDRPELVPPSYEVFTRSKADWLETKCRESFAAMNPPGHNPLA
jgi:hypothetical protein